MTGYFLAAVGAVVTALAVAEVKGGLTAAARLLVRKAVRKLPADHGARWEEEWLRGVDDLSDRPVSALLWAGKVFRDASELRQVLGDRPAQRSRTAQGLKRSFDLATCGAGVFVLLPLLAVIALGIRLDSGGPILARELRVGEKGRVFRVLRFRTLGTGPGDASVTRVGGVLRFAGLDYLPMLLNVLRGEMSLVGPTAPRLQMAFELNRRRPERVQPRPGIVPAHLGNGPMGIDDYLDFNDLYVEAWTLRKDLRVLRRSLAKTLRAL